MLYENAIIDYRIYDEIKDLTKDNYICTTEINTESNNWYLKRKKNDTLTIIENYEVHPRNVNNYLEKILVFTKMHNHYNNKIKEMPNYNDSYYNNIGKISDTTNLDEMRSIIFDNWLDSSICFSSRAILEEKKYHKTINDNSLEFLFSYNVMSYLNSDEYNNNPAKHVLTVINEEINGKKTKEIIDFLENYAEKEENIRLFATMSLIPFIVKTANEYFNLNIDNKLIRDFYSAYFDYVKFEMHNFNYQLAERIIMILFYLTININNRSEIEKLLHLFPHAYHHLKSFLNDVTIDRYSGKMNIEFNDILYTISKDSSSLYLSVTDSTINFDHYLSILGRFDS